MSVRFESPGYFEVRSEEPSGYATEVITDNTQDIHAAKDVPQQQEQEEENEVHYHRGR